MANRSAPAFRTAAKAQLGLIQHHSGPVEKGTITIAHQQKGAGPPFGGRILRNGPFVLVVFDKRLGYATQAILARQPQHQLEILHAAQVLLERARVDQWLPVQETGLNPYSEALVEGRAAIEQGTEGKVGGFDEERLAADVSPPEIAVHASELALGEQH